MRATTRSCWAPCAKLSDKGNTLVVVEHDEDTIRHADHIIDIGPSAGKRGGKPGGQGSVAEDRPAPRIRRQGATCCTPCGYAARVCRRSGCYGGMTKAGRARFAQVARPSPTA